MISIPKYPRNLNNI